MTRPNNYVLIILSCVVALFIATLMFSIFPEGSSIRAISFFVGLCTPPIFALYVSHKRWIKYVEEMKRKYEKAKQQLRVNPNSQRAREHMVETDRSYYSCLRENGVLTIYDEQAIANDLKAIVG